MILAISQIKSYRFADLYCFLDYYLNKLKIDKLIIVEDESLYNTSKIFNLFDSSKLTVIDKKTLSWGKCKGDNKQAQIVNCVLNQTDLSVYNYLITPDDDEFWWYDKALFNTLEECFDTFFNKLNLNTICVPWTMLSSKEILDNRSSTDDYIHTFTYRAEVPYIEYKPILRNPNVNNFVNMHYGNTGARNIFDINEKPNKFYRMKLTDFDFPLRLYHYRMTTNEEYKIKMSRNIQSNTHRSYAPKELKDFCRTLYGTNFKGFNVEDKSVLNFIG